MTDNRPITVKIYPCEDLPGQWGAEIPEMNIASQGNDRMHAIMMIAEAAKITVDDDVKHGWDPFERCGSRPSDHARLLHATRILAGFEDLPLQFHGTGRERLDEAMRETFTEYGWVRNCQIDEYWLHPATGRTVMLDPDDVAAALGETHRKSPAEVLAEILEKCDGKKTTP